MRRPSTNNRRGCAAYTQHKCAAYSVRRLAQQPAAPYLALWNRLTCFDPAPLDAAFAEHRIVKASLLRITLHAVAVEDHPPFHQAMTRTLRAARLGDRRFTRTGLTSADADDRVEELLGLLSEPRTNAEVEAHFAARFPRDAPDRGLVGAADVRAVDPRAGAASMELRSAAQLSRSAPEALRGRARPESR